MWLSFPSKRLHCASVNSHSVVGLVSWQWDTVERACVLCNRRIHKYFSFSAAILTLGKPRCRREPNLGCRDADRPGIWAMQFLPEKEVCTGVVEWAVLLMQIRWSARSVIVNKTAHSTQTQSTRSHCRLPNPTGEWLFKDTQYGLMWLAAKLHQGHATNFRDIQNGGILSEETSGKCNCKHVQELKTQADVFFHLHSWLIPAIEGCCLLITAGVGLGKDRLRPRA
jgi:hypothetical protein